MNLDESEEVYFGRREQPSTPVDRLARLALEALDGDDPEMVRICLRRLLNLGDKT